MEAPGKHGRRTIGRHLVEAVWRAFVEFLTIPTLVIGGFLLLALIMFFVDEGRAARTGGAREMWGGLFNDVQATRDFLGVIAGSIITVTSITLSLLLIAVQQGAASLTSLVFDQFLRRRTNQFYFGFFIGLALYSLIILASTNPSHQPVYGVALAGLLAAAALYMLIFLIYTTINQMRPVVIIRSIRDHTLVAREHQLALLRTTRRSPRLQGESILVEADCSGFLARLDVAAIAKAVAGTETEVAIRMSIGEYVTFGDAIAEVRMTRQRDVDTLEAVIRRAVAVEEQRDLDCDPAFGIGQLVTIGWTSISTAKSNPDPGLLAIYNLRDLLARWVRRDDAFSAGAAADPESQVVYRDNLAEELLRGFESLVVVASESMQHQCAAEIYRTFAMQFPRLPPFLRRRAADLLLRSLSGLGDHVPTSDLQASLAALAAALDANGHPDCADAVDTARRGLEAGVGRLHSRSTRVDASEHAPRNH